MTILRIGFVIFILYVKAFAQNVCSEGDTQTCVCEKLDNTGTIDLRSIGSDSKDVWFFDVPSSVYPYQFYYSYNPCHAFTGCNGKEGLSLVMTPGDSAEECLGIGMANSSRFVVADNGDISLHYDSYHMIRTSIVYLECNTSTENNTFIQFGDDYDRINFTFRLHGPASCAILPTHQFKKTILITAIVVGLVICVSIGLLFKYILRKRRRQLSDESTRICCNSSAWKFLRLKPQTGDVLDDENTTLTSPKPPNFADEEEEKNTTVMSPKPPIYDGSEEGSSSTPSSYLV